MYVLICVCIPVLDFAVSLSSGTADTPSTTTTQPPKKTTTLHPPLQLPGVLAVFGGISLGHYGNVLLSLQAGQSLSTPSSILSLHGVSLVLSVSPTQRGVGGCWGSQSEQITSPLMGRQYKSVSNGRRAFWSALVTNMKTVFTSIQAHSSLRLQHGGQLQLQRRFPQKR